MTEQANADIDYEQMDDLPLTEHFEWHLLQVDEVDIEKSNETSAEWQIA